MDVCSSDGACGMFLCQRTLRAQTTRTQREEEGGGTNIAEREQDCITRRESSAVKMAADEALRGHVFSLVIQTSFEKIALSHAPV